MVKQKKWRVKHSNPVIKHIIARELNISSIVAQLLMNRGICTVDAARDFLYGDLKNIPQPELLKDMEKAVLRITKGLNEKEKILVYGDYDADGITSTTLMVSFLRRLGGIVDYYIPHRIDEGYGMNLPALKRAGDTGYTLIITVDCGISEKETVEQVNSEGGPDIIITDHHEPPEHLPPVHAVLDPKRADCRYPFKELAGVGVAFKLCQGIQKELGNDFISEQELYEYLDLVCVGTVADIVPLKGENRILVKRGLDVMTGSDNAGLQALMHVSSIDSEKFDTRSISFGIAPRLNAAGRLGDASRGVELLLEEDYDAAFENASMLNKENQRRQKMESLVLAEAVDMLENQPEIMENKVLVLASANWHPGVIGIVASKLLERYYRPVLLVSLEGNTGKGSARSIPGFNIYRALEYCRDMLDSYGGHEQAAGLTLPGSKVDEFRREINKYADQVLSSEDMIPGMDLDTVVPLESIDEDLINQLDKLSPHGYGNPHPLFGCRDVRLLNYRGVGKDGAHLKMLVRGKQVNLDGIGFNLGGYAETLATREVDLAFVPAINQWNGKRSVQLEVKDLQPTVAGLHSQPRKEDGKGNVPQWAEEVLKQNPQEMFLPAFINNELIKYGLKKGESNYLIDYSLKDSYIEQVVAFSDWRNYPERERLLYHLCSGSGNKLILVNFPYQAVELFCMLVNNMFSREDIFIYSYCNEENLGNIKEILNHDSGKLVISIPEIPLGEKEIKVEHLVYYTLPFHAVEFHNVLKMCSYGELHCLFNEYDIEKAAGYLNSLGPERDFMAGFYNLLRTLRQRNCSRFSMQDAVKALKRNNYPAVYPYCILIALKVFQELELLDFELQEGYDCRFELNPRPDEKLSLSKSPAYNYFLQVKSECREWQHHALTQKNPFNAGE